MFGSAGAVALTGALVIVMTTAPSESSEAHTRTAVGNCMKITDPSKSKEDRYAECLDKVLGWIAAHDGDLDELRGVGWAESASGPVAATAVTPSRAASSAAPSSAAPTTARPSPTLTIRKPEKEWTTATKSSEPSPSSSPVTDAVTAAAAEPTTSPSTRPDATPSATSDPLATANGFTAAFGSRPSSGAVVCDGQSNVTISGKTFKGIGNDTPAITIRNCTNVRIVQNDFIDDTEPIYVFNSTNVTIEYNRYRNITGPHERNGSHRGNFTQWENSFGGSISHNVGIGGDTEDIVSIYKSGGRSGADPLVIADNWFQGTNWTSQSGSGIMLGDNGGSHVVIKKNVLVNAGQVGIGVAGGSNIKVVENTVLGQPRNGANVGIYVWGQGGGCADVHVANNTVDFAKGSGVVSGGWNGGNCGNVTGWDSNNWTAKLGLEALQVKL